MSTNSRDEQASASEGTSASSGIARRYIDGAALADSLLLGGLSGSAGQSPIPPLSEQQEREYARFAKVLQDEIIREPHAEAQLDAYVDGIVRAAHIHTAPINFVIYVIYRRASEHFRQVIATSVLTMPNTEEGLQEVSMR